MNSPASNSSSFSSVSFFQSLRSNHLRLYDRERNHLLLRELEKSPSSPASSEEGTHPPGQFFPATSRKASTPFQTPRETTKFHDISRARTTFRLRTYTISTTILSKLKIDIFTRIDRQLFVHQIINPQTNLTFPRIKLLALQSGIIILHGHTDIP